MDARSNPSPAGEAAKLNRAARLRLERDRQLSMSERLARVHELCKQMTAVAGAAERK